MVGSKRLSERARGGQPKRHARAALMALRRGRADQRAARGTELRARVFLARAAEKTAHLFAEPVQFPAQARRKMPMGFLARI